MRMADPFCISFSGITLRFVPKEMVAMPEDFQKLLTADTETVDAEYEICPLESPIVLESPPEHCNGSTEIYRTEKGTLWIYSLRRGRSGEQVALFLGTEGKHRLYFPKSLWDHYTSPVHCSHLLGIEKILLDRAGFLLHSSVVELFGKTVLFSGPSGIGKSTQADLWARHLGARILNGDRTVVMRCRDGFYGGGSPYAGHSRIYRKEQFPIAGIFLLEQSNENRVARLGADAFAPLLSQILINSWDLDFMDRLTGLLAELLTQVPVYRLSCRPDHEAVELAYQTIFGP